MTHRQSVRLNRKRGEFVRVRKALFAMREFAQRNGNFCRALTAKLDWLGGQYWTTVAAGSVPSREYLIGQRSLP